MQILKALFRKNRSKHCRECPLAKGKKFYNPNNKEEVVKFARTQVNFAAGKYECDHGDTCQYS